MSQESRVGPKRLVIVGCSCSGKTTMSKRVAQLLDADHVELDAIHNLSGWRSRDRAEMRDVVLNRLSAPAWVVDGNYTWLAEDVWPLADAVVFLDPPRLTVLRRAVRRTLARVFFRKLLWNGNRETWRSLLTLDQRRSIILWSWRRHPFYRRYYRDLLAAKRPQHVMVHLRSTRETRDFLSRLRSDGG